MKKSLIKYFILILILNISLIAFAQETDFSNNSSGGFRFVSEKNRVTNDVKSANEENFKTQGYKNADYEANDVMVPANTVFMASSMSNINSDSITIGQNVGFYLASDFYYQKKLIAPEGSIINAVVLNVNRGGGKKYAEIYFKFTNLVTPYGQVIPISAKIKTKDRSGVLRSIVSNIINIDENTMFNIILTQPVTVSINNPY